MSEDLNTPPLPESGEEVVERDEAAKRRSPDFREAMCRGWNKGLGWWNNETKRWSTSNDRPVRVDSAAVCIGMFGTGTLLYVQVETPDPSKPRRKSSIVAMLGADVVSLLKLSPNNATFRARVMAKLNEPPPKDCDTYEKLKDWVEFNFPKHVVAPPPPVELAIRVSASQQESGLCRYSRTLSGSGTLRISKNEAVRLIQNASLLDDAISDAHDLLLEKVSENIHMEGNGCDETSDHDSSQSEGVDLDYSSSDLKNFIKKIALETIEGDEEREEYGLE